MADKYLNQVGDHEELENCCRNVLELDLSKNEFMCWNEVVIKIQNSIKKFSNLINSFIKIQDKKGSKCIEEFASLEPESQSTDQFN